MNKALSLLILLISVVAYGAKPPVAPVPKTVQNRFLFILETSAGMERVSEPATTALLQLIASGAQGQMSPGDSFALWTFSHLVWADMPVQTWNPKLAVQTGNRVHNFIKSKKFEKESNFTKLLTPIQAVVRDSKAVTIILICEGKKPITGTPFDAEIAELLSRNYKELRAAKLPFVIALVGREGELVDFAVNSSLGPYKIPNPPLPLAEPTRPSQGSTNLPPAKKTVAPRADVIVTNAPAVAVIPPAEPPQAPRTDLPATPGPTAKSAETVAVPVNEKTNSAAAGPVRVVTNSVPAESGNKSSLASQKSDPIQITNPPAALLPKQTNSFVAVPESTNRIGLIAERPPLPAQSNLVAARAQATNLAIAEIPAPTVPDRSQLFLYLGIGLIVAALLIAFIVLGTGAKRKQSSLISESLNKR